MSAPTTTRVPLPDAMDVGRVRSWRATIALSRVETARLIRHPAVLVGLLAYLLPWLYSAMTRGEAGRFPVLQDSDRGTQIRLLPLALATLLAANMAMLRPAQSGADAQLEVLVLSARHRAAALLAALVPVGLIAAALVGARMTDLAVQSGASGHPNPFELAGGPLMVVLLGVVGVLLGSLTRSAAAAPLAMVTLAVAVLAAMLPGRLAQSSARWLLPLASRREGAPPLPISLLGRPAGWHLAYLTGLIVVLAVATLAVNKMRTSLLGVVSAAGVVLILIAGVLQLRSPSGELAAARDAATYQPAAQQICEHRGQLTYCSFPDFRPQIAGWDNVLQGILRRLPPAVADQPWTVRQRVQAAGNTEAGAGMGQPVPLAQWQNDDNRHGTPASVPVATSWNDNATVIDLAGQFAYRAVTGRAAPADGLQICEARGALVIWLAGQASPRSRKGLDSLISGSSGGVAMTAAGFGSGYYVADRVVAFGLRMLSQPADTISARVRSTWPELTTPGTSFERAGELLGITPPPTEQDGICS
ncbi:hypothetical protein MXD59_06700 [Frankia sp. Ag45/Mut15]|uniref:ABC transporter permease n=1 Tax=Frankia umida TaxID=573489 RepID=A0ABT0JVA7_9ACTN|nr:hypothetical protein [Frankia umida]MCK9875467.1 hypothetical protein [Frankia umida]